MNTAQSARNGRQQVRGETKQFPNQRVERPNLGHVRTVLALCGPVLRDQSLVMSSAVPAVPASQEGLQSAPTVLDSDFNFDATRLRCRPSARPQSPISGVVVVAFPMKATTVRGPVAKHRSGTPPRGGRTRPAVPVSISEDIGSHRPSADCAVRSLERGTHDPYPTFFAETGGGATRLSWGVGPFGGVGIKTLSHIDPESLWPSGLCMRVEEKQEAPFGASEPPARRRAESLMNQAVANWRVVTLTS